MSANQPPLLAPPVINTWTGEPLEPVSPGDRIPQLDVLRGFALFGILMVNMALFSWPFHSLLLEDPPWKALPDVVADWVVGFAAEGKFYPLFSLLFGIGMGLQMDRAASRNRKFGVLFCRRLLVLLVIGLLHALLIWEGDILTCYAVFGFILLAFQNCKPRTLLIWSAISLLAPVLFFVAIWAILALVSLIPGASSQIDAAFDGWRTQLGGLVSENIRIFSQGTWSQIFVQRAKNVAASWQNIWFFAPTFFGMFLLGLYASRRRVLQNVEANLELIRRTRTWGFGIGVPANLCYMVSAGTSDPMAVDFEGVLRQAALGIGGPLLCLGYVAGALLMLRSSAWRALSRPIGAAGRMALSNYLLQSIVCTTLCYSYGLGWYGSLGRLAGLGVAVVLYVVQLGLSVWWLQRFRFGPAEWIWRAATYGMAPRLRI